MAPLSPWASPSPSPQYNSKNLRRGLLQEGVGASSSSAAWKRLGTNHLPPERSASFHGRSTNNASASTDPHQSKQQIRRPKTQPDLIAATGGRPKNINTSSPTPGDLRRIGSSTNFATSSCTSREQQQQMMRKVPAKVLVNVNVQRSLGALQVMASTEWTVHQLVAAAVKQYVKEGRRPLLPSTDPSTFGLHYSQFSLECLDPEEKLIGLGSRTFFLCPKTTATAISASTLPAAGSASASSSSSSSSSCSKEADRVSKITIPWLRFMDFLF